MVLGCGSGGRVQRLKRREADGEAAWSKNPFGGRAEIFLGPGARVQRPGKCVYKLFSCIFLFLEVFSTCAATGFIELFWIHLQSFAFQTGILWLLTAVIPHL